MTTGEQLHRITENVYRNIIDGFTPEVRTLIAQGKVYDKALQGVTQAAKEYFDAIVKVGEAASDTKGSRQLGQSLLQIAETYRQIEAERDALVHSLRKELLLPLENKLDHEWKFIPQNQKAYLSENKAKAEAVEKRRNDVKKLQKKTQKNHSEKYLEKEQKSLDDLHQLSKQLLSFRSQSLREAWCEQRKRYAYLVERYCSSIKNEAAFYGKAQSVLQYRLPKWSESCEKPYKLPEECEEMLSMVSGENELDFSGPLESPLHMELRNSMKMLAKSKEDSSGSEKSQSRPVSLASQEMERPLSVEVENQPPTQPVPPSPTQPPMTEPPPEPNHMMHHMDQTHQSQQMAYMSATLPNRGKAAGGLKYSKSVMYNSPGSKYRPQVQRHSSESGDSDRQQLSKVRCVYNHIAASETQLNFQEGDIVALVGPHNNGWYFGHNYRTKKNGWFPISFTQPLDNGFSHANGSMQAPPPPTVPYPQPNMHNQQHHQNSPLMSTRKGMSVSSENLARTNGDNYPSPDYSVNDSPSHMKFFGSNPPPPSQTHGGLLIATSQQSLQSNVDTSSGSQLSSGSLTPQNSSGLSEAIPEKPSTPTHPPPPVPSEIDGSQPTSGEGESANPLLNVNLRKTVTDDRSAPQIPRDYSLNH